MKKFLPSLLWNIAIISSISAQAPLRFTPVFRNYTTNDGLPSNETFAIEQDRNGYMWFSTNNGVCRFNGYEFKQFPDTLQTNSTSIMSLAMMEDSCGRMWWADFQGRVFYHENGRIIPWKYNSVLDSLRPGYNNQIHGMIVRGCGEEIWLNIHRLGILHSAKNGSQQLLHRPDSVLRHLFVQGDRIINADVRSLNSIHRVHKNSVFIQNEGLSTPSLPCPEKGVVGMDYISKLSNRRYLICRGQYIYLLHGVALQQWRQYDKDIAWIKEEEDGSLLIGHRRGGGVRHFASVNDLMHKKIAASFLEGWSISNIFKDREGGYWFGSQERGLFYCPSLQSGIAAGLPGMTEDVVKGVVSDGAGRIYFATYNGRVFELDLFRNICRDITPGTLEFLN